MSGGPEYFDRVGAHFSAEVESLDTRDRENPIHAYIRRVSLATLDRVMPARGRLLEFGYGTGTEAVYLASRGATVVGLDPSGGMRERATAKATAAGVGERCDFRGGSTADTATLVAEFGASSFDGAFATLGPLNCDPDLPAFGAALARILKPRAPLVTLIINRHCPWEVAGFLAKGDLRRAFRRYNPELAALRGPQGTDAPALVWTYTPTSFARALGAAFTVEERFALPAVLPPPYAAPALARFGSLARVLQSADERLAHRWPFPWLGDHFEVVMRRKGSPTNTKP